MTYISVKILGRIGLDAAVFVVLPLLGIKLVAPALEHDIHDRSYCEEDRSEHRKGIFDESAHSIWIFAAHTIIPLLIKFVDFQKVTYVASVPPFISARSLAISASTLASDSS